jgi:hypothetical protein
MIFAAAALYDMNYFSRVSWTREVLLYMDKSTWKEHPPYALLVILEGVIVYYHT